jgi:hypothetical protein
LIAGDSSLNNLEVHGDVSLNGNLYVGGDISWNPNNLADNSIPSSAIIGGAVGVTGPPGPMSSTNNVLHISANQTTSGNYSNSNDTANTFFTDTTKSNVYCSLANASDFFEIVYHKDYSQSVYENYIGFLLKPGVYMFEYSGGDIQWSTGWLDDNGSGGYAPEVQIMQGQHTKKDIFTIPDGPKMIYALKDIKQESTGSSTSVRIKSYEGGTFNLSITQLKEGIWNNVTPFSGINNGSTFNQWILSTALSASSTQINIPSSVEVASFHSDADLSLNKRLFVGEFINTTNFYNVNSLLMPYYLVEWTNPSVGNIDTIYNDFRLLFKAGKLHTNIHSNQLSIEAGSGGLSNASPDPDNYVAFKVYPGVWELNFEINETGVGSNANTNYVQICLYHDNGSGTTPIHNSHGTSFNSTTTGYLKDFRYFTVPNGKSGWVRILNGYTQDTRRIVVRNTGTTIDSATNIIPTVHLKCIQLNNWDGTDSSLTGVDSMNSTSIVSDWNSQNAIDYNTATNVFVNQI